MVEQRAGRRSSHCHSSSETAAPPPAERKVCLNGANKLSEELVRLMVAIFHKLNRTADDAAAGELGTSSKLNISCIGPRSLVPRAAVTGAAAAMSPLKNRRASAAKAAPEKDAAAAGCPKRFVEFTRASVDVGRISLCLVDIKNLR